MEHEELRAEEHSPSTIAHRPLGNTASPCLGESGRCSGKGNGHKLKQRKFQLHMRKNFFPLRVTEHWDRLPREAVESPSLEIFKTRLHEVLCSLL